MPEAEKSPATPAPAPVPPPCVIPGVNEASTIGTATRDLLVAPTAVINPFAPDRPVPHRVGDCTITRFLGAGGMGAVFEATQDNPRRLVALKLIRSDRPSPQRIDRFIAEAQTLARLSHPCIAQIFSAGVHEGPEEPAPYFTMELVRGGTDIATFARRQALSLRERLALMILVCDAVQHAHDHGIVHRDLKPANILIDHSGNPKVIDFGVAHTRPERDLGLERTTAGQFLGTWAYMAPEQCGGRPGGADVRCDVYALGAILYELITGRPTHDFRGVEFPDEAAKVRQTPPVRPGRINPLLRGDLEAIVLAAIRPDRLSRYASAAELRDDLRRFLGGEPVVARRESPGALLLSRVRASVARRPLVALLLVSLLAAAGGRYIGVPLFYRWTGAGRGFERAAYPALTSLAAPASLPHCRVVTVNPETPVAELAERAGVPGAKTGEKMALRPVYGTLLPLLADAGARAVVLDITFQTDAAPADSAFDKGLAAGLRDLQERSPPVPVVLAVKTWKMDAKGFPVLAPSLRPLAFWGVTQMTASPQQPWVVDLGVQRGLAGAMPSLSSMAAALWRSPELNPTFWPSPNMNAALVVQFASPERTPGGVALPVGKPLLLNATFRAEVGAETLIDFPEAGLSVGDEWFRLAPAFPTAGALADATVPIQMVFAAAPEQRRAWFGGRVVFIADARRGQDEAVHPQLGTIPLVYTHVAGVETLLGQRSMTLASTNQERLATLAAAAFTAGAVYRSGRRWRWVVGLLALGAWMLASLAVTRYAAVWLPPLVPALAIVLAIGPAAYIRRLRAARVGKTV